VTSVPKRNNPPITALSSHTDQQALLREGFVYPDYNTAPLSTVTGILNGAMSPPHI
jgi:hypothetical protein